MIQKNKEYILSEMYKVQTYNRQKDVKVTADNQPSVELMKEIL